MIKYNFIDEPEEMFIKMSRWLEKKKIAAWIAGFTVIYMVAQIIRALVK